MEEASCHVLETLKQPCGNICMVRNGGLLPTASNDLKLSTISCGNEVPSQSQSNLHTTVAVILSDSILMRHSEELSFFPIISLAIRMVRTQLAWAAHLCGWPERPAGSLRNTQAGLRGPSGFSRDWCLFRTLYWFYLLLVLLAAETQLLPGPERRWNSVLSVRPWDFLTICSLLLAGPNAHCLQRKSCS